MLGRGTHQLLFNFEYYTGTKVAKEVVKDTLKFLEQSVKSLEKREIPIKLTDNEINEQLKQLEKERKDFYEYF